MAEYTSLLLAIFELIGTVMGEREFSTADHILAVKEEQQEGKKYQYNVNAAKLWVIVSGHVVFDKQFFFRAKNATSWLSIWGTTITGTVLNATGFCGIFVLIIMLPPLKF